MEHALTPAVGSNQHLTKFDAQAKRKFKFKVRFATKVKIGVIILLFASLYLNYVVLKTNYVVTCSAGGHFISKQQCGELSDNAFAARETAREQFMQNNQDLFGGVDE